MKTQLILTRLVELLPELMTFILQSQRVSPRVIFILNTATPADTPVASQFNRTAIRLH